MLLQCFAIGSFCTLPRNFVHSLFSLEEIIDMPVVGLGVNYLIPAHYHLTETI